MDGSSPFQLRPGETLLWEGRPALGPFVATSAQSALTGAFWLAGLLWLALWVQGSSLSSGLKLLIDFVVFPASLIPLLMMFPLILCYKAYRLTRYQVTDQRVLFAEGLLRGRIRSLEWSQVANIQSVQRAVNRLWKTGTIQVVSNKPGEAELWYAIHAIARPEETLALLQGAWRGTLRRPPSMMH
jgi:hypothetical protein